MQEIETREFSASRPTIAYVRRDGTGDECVLLLHGVGSSASTWHRLLPLIDERFTVIAPDYRGHGESEVAPVPYVLDDFVGDAVRLLDELGLDRVHVVGFSIGAIFAEALAIEYPDRVAALVLLNSIGSRTDAEAERALVRLDVIRSTPPALGAPASVERWFTEGFRRDHPDDVAAELAIVSSTPHEAYAASYEVLATTDLIDSVDEILSPVLLITGENDVGSTPRMSQAVHERIPGSHLVVIDGLQHYLHVEVAERIADLVNDFLGSHPAHHPPVSPTRK
jgi:pimeloyl-ACP methyl ester carboxylesterase